MKILCVNSGSSSIKFALYTCGNQDSLVLSGSYHGIGSNDSSFTLFDSKTGKKLTESVGIDTYGKAASHLFSQIGQSPDLISHRIVQGGPNHSKPMEIDQSLLKSLERWKTLAPNHVPPALELIEACRHLCPEARNIACFDTAFHQSRPEHRKIYALPREYAEKGILRYGFHGLSYEYIVMKVKKIYPDIFDKKLIICHLGHGASLAAVEKGKCQETTMGFSPVSGLVMSTRTGDMDPEIPIYLQQAEKMGPEEIRQLIHKQSGLLGLSEKSGDMEKLLKEAPQDKKSREAVEIFCESVVKHIGALCFLMEGLDALIFTGGIGENSPEIRLRICKSLNFYGLKIDDAANKKNGELISTEDSQLKVQVISTNEEEVLMRRAKQVMEETRCSQ